jgi:hypothetical protein
MTMPEIERLIQWLRNASVGHFDFTIEGSQEVCKPKYLLVRDRDFIIGLLEKEKAAYAELSKYGEATR